MGKQKLESGLESRAKRIKTGITNDSENNDTEEIKNNIHSIEKEKNKENDEYVSETAKKDPKTINKNSMEKPNWLEIKKQKKELKEKYKTKRFSNIYDITIVVKQIGEKLRRSDCTKLERKKLILKAHDLLKTNYNRIILTHDMSRIVQWILKYCDAEIRQAIYQELQPSLVSMFESKYAKNCIKNLLKYGSQEIKHEIISSCYGNVIKFMSHSVSAPLLELIYTTWAREIEKTYFQQEFYGDMYKHAKDSKVKSLSDVFKFAEDMKAATLSAVKGNLMRLLNKKIFNSTLLHCVLFEFLNNCSAEDRTEIIVILRDSVVELSQTKFGSKVAAMCIWHGTNKDRKHIMKALKDNVKTISTSEHGYLILLALFDAVDDIVLLKKIILSEIERDLTDIAINENGKHVILYLVARRNSHYFPPTIVKYLEQGDNNATSKKPANIREKELLESIYDSLIQSVTSNITIWMSNSSIAMVTLAILKIGTGKKLETAFKSVAEFITNLESKIKEGNDEYMPVEHAGIHMMLKKLIQNDKELQEKNESSFGEVLVNHLERNVMEKWIECNRGCFILILLLENETESAINTLSSKLKPIKSVIKSKSIPGAKILHKKLKEMLISNKNDN